MDPKTLESKLVDLIHDYVMATWLKKKDVMRLYVPVLNVMSVGWKLIQKKKLCQHCQGDGQGRCEKVACVTGTQTEECPDCRNKEDRRTYDICTYCGGFGDTEEYAKARGWKR